jgi:pimeloyl-ACP methyl ester carboxylesterase
VNKFTACGSRFAYSGRAAQGEPMSVVYHAASLVAIWLALTAAAYARSAIDVSALKAFPCPSDEGYIEKTAVRHCGYLRTTEGGDGTGRPIDIAVVILIPSDPERAKKAPTVFVHGGPGYAVVDIWWSVALLNVANEGPLVIFDHRAVGKSKPKLCTFLDVDDQTLDKLSAEGVKKRMLIDTKKCIDGLTKDGVDLATYTSAGTVADMEALRRALKIEKWNVYGVSYGTTVTLAYVATHPDRVRAAVIDSVYPPEMASFSTVVPDGMEAIEAMNRVCQTQPRCKARFGDLRTLFDQAIVALDKAPHPVRVIDPTTGKVATRHVSSSTLFALVQGRAIQSAAWPIVPLMMADARDGKPSTVLNSAFTDMLFEYKLINNGAYLAVECYERAPFDSTADLANQAARWPNVARAAGVDTLFEVCAQWPAKSTQNWTTPAGVAPPILVVGGEWDPVTPATQARATAERLGAKAQLLITPKAAHAATMYDRCTESIVTRFINAPDAKVDTACVAARRDPVFATGVISFDAQLTSQPDALPASSFVFLAGLLSALLWPAAWTYAAVAERRFAQSEPWWRRASFWLACAALGLLAWAYPAAASVLEEPSVVYTWMRYGIPLESWPTFPALLLIIAAGAIGSWRLIVEARNGTLTTLQLAHRGFVVAALIAVLVSLLQLGMLAQLPELALDQVKLLTEIL